jgi:hypothetical protein
MWNTRTLGSMSITSWESFSIVFASWAWWIRPRLVAPVVVKVEREVAIRKVATRKVMATHQCIDPSQHPGTTTWETESSPRDKPA